MDDIKQAARKTAAVAIFQHEHSGNSLDNVAAAILEAKAEILNDVMPPDRKCFCGGSKGHWPNCPNSDRWKFLAARERYLMAANEVRRGE